MKIKVIGFPGPSGSRIYRMEQVFKYLNKTGEFDCVISPMGVEDKQLLWADIIFLQHTIDPRSIADAWAYKIERGKKIVTDLDDTIEYKEDSPFYQRNKKNNAKPWQRELIKVADLVTVTTLPLKKEAGEFNKNVYLLPNYLDMEMWDIPTTPNETGIIRIGWSGSITHRPDLDMVMPVIRKILLKYDTVKFISCGDTYVDEQLNGIGPTRHEYVQAIPSYVQWPLLAHSLSYDIAIAPLVPTYFNSCKSFLKYLEYGMTKTAGIYSPTAYDETVKHGETGYIAKSPKEWEKYLTMLIESPGLRYRIRDGAYNNVVTNYSMQDHVSEWSYLYKNLLDKDSTISHTKNT